jgi:hypothetical protein
VRIGFLSLFLGLVTLMAALEAGAGPEVVTLPMLLAGLGIGALASQLGSVTVSSVPDEETDEVGGLQNTVTFLGSSFGTALSGAVLIAALTSSFFTGIQDNPAIPASLSSQAQVQLASGVPFIPDSQLSAALTAAGVHGDAANAIMEENTTARLAGLRASLGVLSILGLVAIYAVGGISTRQPGAAPEVPRAEAAGAGPDPDAAAGPA